MRASIGRNSTSNGRRPPWRPLASSLPPRVFGSAQRAVPGAADQETTADLLRAADRVLNASKQEDETAGVAGLAYPA